MMRKLSYIIPSFLLLALASGVLSCKKSEGGGERNDYIRIYESADGEEMPLDRSWVSVKGGTTTYYIRSNVDFQAKWQSEDASWAAISEPKKVGDGLWSIDVTVQPMAERSLVSPVEGAAVGMYTRRYGVLMLTCPDRYLGKYLVIEQGFESRISCNFSWLYGSADPNDTYNDVVMSRWTVAQQNQGFRSTQIEGEEDAWVFSKDGYLKLGNDRGAGADLITPRTADFQYDTLLVVAFRAVVQNGDVLPDYMGGTEPIVPMSYGISPRSDVSVDENHLRVEVSGGGYIRDFVESRGTSITLELPTYDRGSAAFPDDMFDGGDYLVFIEGTDSNPITVNTAIRFVAGDMKASDDGVCSRVFLDDIFVYRLDPLLDEDLYRLNGGTSGKNRIGGKADE